MFVCVFDCVRGVRNVHWCTEHGEKEEVEKRTIKFHCLKINDFFFHMRKDDTHTHIHTHAHSQPDSHTPTRETH